jgi:hypothetical protein
VIGAPLPARPVVRLIQIAMLLQPWRVAGGSFPLPLSQNRT